MLWRGEITDRGLVNVCVPIFFLKELCEYGVRSKVLRLVLASKMHENVSGRWF